MVGATNVNGGGLVYYLGTGTSFDVSHISGYQNLTADNFIVCLPEKLTLSASGGGRGSSGTGRTVSGTSGKSYNASTGILTVNSLSTSFGIGADEGNGHWCNGSASVSAPKVYLVKGKIKNT